MKIITLLLLLSSSTGLARWSGAHLEVSSTIDTTNVQIRQVLQLWENYLSSNPDSSDLNPYWSESEQRQYHPYDFAAHTWWGASLYGMWLPHCRVSVLSVSPVGETYLLRSLFYWLPPGDSGGISVITILQTGARRENGAYKLCNSLSINTQSWIHQQVGSIRFISPPEHQFNRPLAERMGRFIDSLASEWKLAPKSTDYYFADDLDRVAKALGFDYWLSEGNGKGPRGFVDSQNRIIYSGGSDEWYPHEFVHIYINPLFPNANGYFLEGYATLLGGSGGHDLSWHLARNIEYLRAHPDLDALTFRGVDMHVPAQYFIGGLLCKMAEAKGGIAGIRNLMSYGKSAEDLYRAIQDTFGISKDKVDNFLRAKMAEYAVK